jgi:hypothetical protein
MSKIPEEIEMERTQAEVRRLQSELTEATKKADAAWRAYVNAPKVAPEWSKCTKVLQKKGVAYPRTCEVCGLGPCQYR